MPIAACLCPAVAQRDRISSSLLRASAVDRRGARLRVGTGRRRHAPSTRAWPRVPQLRVLIAARPLHAAASSAHGRRRDRRLPSPVTAEKPPCADGLLHERFQARMMAARCPPALSPASITVLAYGALLSERSARLTFPALSNFRLARVQVPCSLRRAVPSSAAWVPEQRRRAGIETVIETRGPTGLPASLCAPAHLSRDTRAGRPRQDAPDRLALCGAQVPSTVPGCRAALRWRRRARHSLALILCESSPGSSFVAAAFDVDLDDQQREVRAPTQAS